MRFALICFFCGLLGTGSAWGQLVSDVVRPAQGPIAVHEWSYRSDGLVVKALVMIPSTSQKLPAVIFCHDGISGISRQHRMASLRLARAGFVVLAPSYRGEDGSQGVIEVAKGEVDDVLAALPLLQHLPQVDPARVGIAGASHGALISFLAASRSPDLKAIVSAYGVMDIYAWWDYLRAANKLGHDAITDRTYGDGPKARPASFQIRNALDVAKKIHCPVLLLQGQKDDIVPPEQAVKMKQALDTAGKPCQLELYPHCLHGFLVYAPYLKHGVEPAERAETEAAWKTMLAFLHLALR